MKTQKDLTRYKYAEACGVTWATIAHRIKMGKLYMNEDGMIPSGTLIVNRLKLGKPIQS